MERFEFVFPSVLKVLGVLRRIMESETLPSRMSIGGIKSLVVPTAARYFPRFRKPIFNACRPANGKTIIYLKDFNTHEIVNVQNAYLFCSAPFGNEIDHMRMDVIWRKSSYSVGLWNSNYDFIMQRYESLAERLPTSLEDLEKWQDYFVGTPNPSLLVCGIPIIVFSFINVLYNLNEVEINVPPSKSKYEAMEYLQSVANRFKEEIGGEDFSTAISNLLILTSFM